MVVDMLISSESTKVRVNWVAVRNGLCTSTTGACCYELKGKVALVTGASGGIGREIALLFARCGADVGVAYRRRRQAAAEVARRVEEVGGRAVLLSVDVSCRESVRLMVRTMVESFGRIDVLVNNAAILQRKPFLLISDEDWDHVLAVNLKGAFICAQEVMPVIMERRGGSIINIASSGGQLGGTLAVHYAVSKAGVIGLTKSLARIGAPYGIRVNCIAPGLIDTDMSREEIESELGQEKIKQILLGRPGTPAEVAHLAAFLASDVASYITGQTFNVNGGLFLG